MTSSISSSSRGGGGGGFATTATATAAATKKAAMLLLLSLSLSTLVVVSATSEGGFQSGPSPGSLYAGGLHYDSKKNTVYMTGSHYNIDFREHDGTYNDLMQGDELDGASSCFISKLDLNEIGDVTDTKSFHTLTNWKSYGDPGIMETCSAITTDNRNQAFVVGSIAKGSSFHTDWGKTPLAGMTAVLQKDDLIAVNAMVATSAKAPNQKLLYPVSVIHSINGDGGRHLYIAALTSTDNTENEIPFNTQTNMQEVHMYGTSFYVSVLKIIYRNNNQKEPELVWIQDFPVDANLQTGEAPPVFIGGMLEQKDSNGVAHLLIAGSTRGSGKGYGETEEDTDDEDGFIMQLSSDDGSFLFHQRHKGKHNKNKNKNNNKDEKDGVGTNNLREGTGSDDLIRGICHADEHSANPSVDEFYIVGGTKGDMTTNEQGAQNDLEEVNAGFQFGAGVESKYRDLWVRDESLMPFIRRVSFQKELAPVWTTQWAAMPSSATSDAEKGATKTDAYAMDCVVDSINKSVYVVGSVLQGASMTQGDVEMINQGGDDIWVAKVDGRTGNVHWMTQLGNFGDESPARHKAIVLNNDGNIIIYGDTTSMLYRARDGTNELLTTSDMFIMVVDGESGAVNDNYYMGGTSSASVTGSVDGVPRETTPPNNDNEIPQDGTFTGDEVFDYDNVDDDDDDVDDKPEPDPSTMKDKDSLNNMSENNTKKSGGIGFGRIITILLALAAIGFGLYAVLLQYRKKKFAETQKSTIFQCLQKFDVEDIDLRRSPPGGWHGTYMNKLAYGVNDADGGADGIMTSPLSGGNGNGGGGGNGYEDQPFTSSSDTGTGTGTGMGSSDAANNSLFSDNDSSAPSLGGINGGINAGGGGGVGGGYKDNFEIDDDDDEVDTHLKGKDLV